MLKEMSNINPKNIFLFSDPHFGHINIIGLCHRPFGNVNQMNETILRNFNKVVRDSSLVYFLGDMAHGRNSKSYSYWFKQLNGHIIKLRGNHDTRGFRETVIHVGDLYFKLVHNPYNSGDWNGWIIHGHVHNKSPFIDFKNKRVNVSVDVTKFRPVRLSYILKIIRDSIWERIGK